MTAEMVSRSGLRDLSWDQLAELLAPGTDETTAAAVMAESRRRERLEQQQAARDAERSTWAEAAHAQYLAADAVCRGVLLSRAGKRAGVTEWSLWSGPEARAMKYASEELREFWLANPRVTVGRYRQQASSGRAAQREDPDARPRRRYRRLRYGGRQRSRSDRGRGLPGGLSGPGGLRCISTVTPQSKH